ncbi:Metallo-dependent phosphatase [Rickenella mellea]|uniref:Metallo-dependent phosphatase n=1 Tax=Rickenella mellea TaxID=50990 RepID=A0A4Y7Q948_9AGAM|nr:Metallo-dependent phosphatase [Rickenella mellea]
MALSIFRFFRSLRSMCLPMTTTILFACLLTWVFILYQPSLGPGWHQRLGWQAWEVVSLRPGDTGSPTNQTGSSHESVPEGVDWWNVTTQETQPDPTSLPLDVWSPLLPHDTGLTEILVAKCVYPPYMANYCWPKSTSSDDNMKGKWVRVNHDLNKRGGFWSLASKLLIKYMYYRRSRRLDVELIDDIVLLPKSEEPKTSEKWMKVKTSLRDGVPHAPPLFLWYRLSKTLNDLTMDEKNNLITELDVLSGDDRPWYGFEKLEPPTTISKGGTAVNVWLTLRRGVKPPPPAPPLHFSHNGTFKILQIADLHFSDGSGRCRETTIVPCKNSDNLTQTLIAHVLDEEKPSMVIFTGDQLNGQGTTWDAKSVIAKFATAVTDRGIPWAAVFGNHDDEDGMTRADQAKLLQALPYSLAQSGPSDLHGVGNYILQVKSADASKTNLLTLYFLDSGAYSKGWLDWFGFFHPTDYDWIHQDQIDWFNQQSAMINPIERPFTPDGTKDLSDIWKRQSAGQVTPALKKLAKPNALMFFHIPLPESYTKADVDPVTGKPLDVGIHNLEASAAAKQNAGFFHKGILQAMETDHTSGRNVREVKVVANGHCHVTENCRRVKGVWLCFGGGGSYSGYGKVGFDRRFRIYDISDFGETIRTYKRTEKDEIVDSMILVGAGAPAPYEGT